MEQGVYVDVLLITNYIINMLLITSVGKLSGRSPKRRKIVAAALLGAATSLTIFLPFMGFFVSLLLKLTISSAIVLIAFSYVSLKVFLKQLFLFFAVSFCFAGIMLGIWLTLSPNWLTYYNGVVYFDVSSFWLIVSTIAAYLVLSLASRFAKGKKPENMIYEVIVNINDKAVKLKGLVDTGNHLTEPFSGTPVVVCGAGELDIALPQNLISDVLSGQIFASRLYGFGLRVRMIPYSNVGGSGVMPAFKADSLIIETKKEILKVEDVYIALSDKKIGDEHYNMLLNPELTGLETKNILTVVPRK